MRQTTLTKHKQCRKCEQIKVVDLPDIKKGISGAVCNECEWNAYLDTNETYERMVKAGHLDPDMLEPEKPDFTIQEQF